MKLLAILVAAILFIYGALIVASIIIAFIHDEKRK